MKGINVGRVVAGGLLAGLVITIGEAILNTVVIGADWERAMTAMGITQSAGEMVYYVVGAFVIGIVGVGLYAAMRPRMGAGPTTAVEAGVVLWLLAWAWPTGAMVFWHLLPGTTIVIALVWGLVEVCLAMLAGAWLYREDVAA